MNDYTKDTDISDLNSTLILKNASDQSQEQTSKKEILKINDLIKTKYFLVKKEENLINNKVVKNFIDIKRSALDQLNNNIKQQTLQIKNSIESQKTELNKLYDEEILFDQNKIQLDIINNQKKLIDDYKQNNNQLKLNFTNLGKKLDETVSSNKKFLINNNELKNTISRYIVHNKNLQNNINQLKKDFNEISLDTSKKDEMISQIKFYQEENVRLSSEIINIQKNYEVIKDNFTGVENEKNNIFKKIKELNNSLIKNNIIGTPFVKETVPENSINSKILNDITDTNLKQEKEKTEQNNDLDDQINNIFK